jgi:PilZ domain-containing protein
MITIVPRAERLTLRIPIAYRLPGEDEWFQSRIVNISESGVLFGPTGLKPGTIVEVMFSCPGQIGSMPPGIVICLGEVVRIDETEAAAAKFRKHRSVDEP